MGITYRELHDGEEGNVCELIIDCSNEFVAPAYSEDGIIEFSKYVTPESTRNRLAKNHFILLALDGNLIVGVIEVRNNNHISFFLSERNTRIKVLARSCMN